jgi:hypothetical protein
MQGTASGTIGAIWHKDPAPLDAPPALQNISKVVSKGYRAPGLAPEEKGL